MHSIRERRSHERKSFGGERSRGRFPILKRRNKGGKWSKFLYQKRRDDGFSW